MKSVVKALRLSHRALAFAGVLLLAEIPACKAPATKSQPVVPAKNELNPSDPELANYDKGMIKAIQVRWMQLLDKRGYGGGVKGHLAIGFNLHSDGSVSDVKVAESDVAPSLAALCERAIKDVSPFAPW